MNLKKLEKMNMFLGVKKKDSNNINRNEKNEFRLDSLHKRLIALPLYDSK